MRPMAHRTGLYREVEDALGSPLDEFVQARRPGKSWRLIAREIEDVTGIALTGETIRVWITYERKAVGAA
jgi:hypothetical protein